MSTDAVDIELLRDQIISQMIGCSDPSCPGEETCPRSVEAVDALLTAAEARGREQERARLAALSPGEVGKMVEEMDLASEVYWTSCDGAEKHRAAERCRSAESTLLAAFAAQRERVVGEMLTWAAGAVCSGCSNGLEYRSGWHYTDELLAARQEGGSPCEAEPIRTRLHALLAAPTKGEGG